MKYFLATISYLILNQLFIKSYADINTNAIINMFCLENVKAEMKAAKIEYKEIFGQKVCNCYLEKISNNKSHEQSISECKKESENNIKS